MENKNLNEKINQTQVTPEEDVVALGKRIIKEKEQKDKVKAAAEYSLAERLMRAVTYDIVEVPVKDDLGEFIVRCRHFTWSERDEVGKLLVDMQNASAKDAKATDFKKRFFKLLAYPGGVCLDQTLDLKFWEGGCYGDMLPAKILKAVFGGGEAAVSAASSFRGDGAGAVPTRPLPEHP